MATFEDSPQTVINLARFLLTDNIYALSEANCSFKRIKLWWGNHSLITIPHHSQNSAASLCVPAHSNSRRQKFLEGNKSIFFKQMYISQWRHGSTSEWIDTTAVPCCEKFIITWKPVCYITKAGPHKLYNVQQPMAYDYKTQGLRYRSIRFTTAHMDYNPGISLQFELKAKRQAGLSKSKHSKALMQQLT